MNLFRTVGRLLRFGGLHTLACILEINTSECKCKGTISTLREPLIISVLVSEKNLRV
jgi:hypothetical protein